ncbi:MAG: hypothetical protein M3Y86_04280 [Verrucomicrobiota bacterium]|nr:hypothetical protein [Verrucomicrobiota bacterium]
MSLAIAGMGWVTPLGNGVASVYERLRAGERATAETITSPIHPRRYPVFRVPAAATAGLPAHPRLRRSSAISRFAAAAGLAALDDAQLKLDEATAARTAIIFAIANGGVIYTKRFYHEVVESGAQSASPLLFPETVFNAPASHLAAILGITGASYTLVGDGAVGVLALKMAEDLLGNSTLDRCLIVGAEEADWLLCDAYSRWHLLRADSPVETFAARPRGTILSEGAGAILLESEQRASARPDSRIEIERIDAGCNFQRQSEAAGCIDQIFTRLHANEADLVVASANGTFVDAAESSVINRRAAAAAVLAPKAALGEGVGAASLWQIICGAEALRTQRLPSFENNSLGKAAPKKRILDRAVVSACGLNQQVAGVSLIR